MLNLNQIIWVVGCVTIMVFATIAICKIHDAVVDKFYDRKLKEAEKRADGGIVVAPTKPNHWTPER